jgi:hypothetical protein
MNLAFIGGHIITTLGFNAILSSITTMTNTTKNIYNLINSIKFIDKTNILKDIHDMDIENTVVIIENMLQEIPKEKICSKTISLCLESINEIVEDIEKDFEIIKSNIEYNNSLWYLKNYRSRDNLKNIENLKINKKILDYRLKLLFELLQITFDIKQIEIKEVDIKENHFIK